jgi:hypothetical protein
MDKLKLKVNLSEGTKISEQRFTTKLGIPSNLTDFVGYNHLRALLMSSSLTEATTNVSLQNEKENCKTPEHTLTENAWKMH